MDKKKIAICFDGKAHDKTRWSGTYYSMYKSLDAFFDVTYIEIRLVDCFATKFYRKISDFLKKIINVKQGYTRPTWYRKLQYRQSNKELYKTKFDFVFVHNIVFGSQINCRKIIYVLDATINNIYNYYDYSHFNCIDYHRYQKCQIHLLKKSYLVCTASEWSKKSVLEDYLIDPNKVIVSYFGANMPFVEKIKRKYTKLSVVNIIFCGVERKRKGLDVAIKTVNYLNTKFNDKLYCLHVIGIGGENTDSVKYYGLLNKSSKTDLNIIMEIYKVGNIFLLPTSSECAGIVFCEASMFSLPIISTNTGGVPSYVKDSFNGYLVNDRSNISVISAKIRELSINDSLRKKMSENSRLLFEKYYNWDTWASTLLSAIERMKE